MGNYSSIIVLVVFIAAMYFLMIRPQKKRDKQIQEMRNSLSVGDEIVTIGGICGKIVKTKDETIVIQVGADKVKFEMMRWSVSTVTNSGSKPKTKAVEEDADEDAPKKTMPKKLKKAADSETAEEAPVKKKPAKKAKEETAEAAEVKAEENTEAKAEADDK